MADALVKQDVDLLLQAFLDISESIVAHQNLSELFHDLAQRLGPLVHFDLITLVLHDPVDEMMRLHILQNPLTCEVGPDTAFAVSVEEAPSGWAWRTQQPLSVPSLAQETRFPQAIQFLRDLGVNSYYSAPLSTGRRRLGAMGFGSTREFSFERVNPQFVEQVAKPVAIAVENALTYQSHQLSQHQLSRERDRLRVLLEVNNAVISILDLRRLFKVIADSLRRVMLVEYATLALYDPEHHQLRVHALDFPGGKGLIKEELLAPVDGSPTGLALSSRKPVCMNLADLSQFHSEFVRLLLEEGVQSVCCVPLVSSTRSIGTLNIASRRDGAFTQEDAEFLGQVANQMAIAVENALAFRQIEDLKNRLAEEKLYLQDEIRTAYNFQEIIGESAALRENLKQIEIVAPTDCTVLIQGETGTGKELIARAIHSHSNRRERTFIKVNCAAIPSGLFENELFGHEKGAFTSAVGNVGRFELADGGTLFLDEVGDIPLELQSKLLRVLQEHEFERLGSTRTLKVNVRVVAATNRDLTQMVTDKQFRSDLFYRLNVFPILAPPLRDRSEDIPGLVRYLTNKYSKRMNKEIHSIPAEAMDVLTSYSWPGNVRELENVIERAVLLSPGVTLRIPTRELKQHEQLPARGQLTLSEIERNHILRTLEETKWVIGGQRGAAVRLGIKRTTLMYKMEKLGIARQS